MMQRITAWAVSGWDEKMIDFKGAHFPRAVILHAVFFYVRYAVSYRDLEEILAERGVVAGNASRLISKSEDASPGNVRPATRDAAAVKHKWADGSA